MISIPQRVLLVAGLAGSALPAQGTRTPLRCSAVADFVALEGRDTISLSRVSITDSAFESTSYSISQGAFIRYTGRLTPAGDVGRLRMEVWPRVVDSAGPPAQVADVVIQGSDVSARVAAPARGIQIQRDRLPPGGVLYMTGAPLFLELFQRRVDLAVSGTTTVPALWLFTGGAVDTVQVTRPAKDSLTLRFPDIEYGLAIGPDRSIFGATSRPKSTTTGSAWRLVRRDCQ